MNVCLRVLTERVCTPRMKVDFLPIPTGPRICGHMSFRDSRVHFAVLALFFFTQIKAGVRILFECLPRLQNYSPDTINVPGAFYLKNMHGY